MTTDHTPDPDPELSSATESPLRAVRTPEGVELHPPDELRPDHRDRLRDAVDRLFDNRTVPQLTGDEEQTTAEIGMVHHADGEVVGLSIDTEYRKPSEREDPSDPLAVFEALAETDSTVNRQAGNPIALRREGTGWRFNFGPEAREAGIEAGDFAVVDLEDPKRDPLVMIAALPEPPENPEQDPLARKVGDRGGSTASVRVPTRHFDDRGLDLDADAYDNQNPLLFEPLVDDGLVGLIPAEYADGTPFVPPAHRDGDGETGTDDTSNAPEPDTPEPVGAIPSDAIAAAAQLTSADAEQVRDALRTLADDLAADADVLADYQVPDYAPVETPGGTVHVVSRDVWDDLDATRTLDAGLQRAVREAHTRAAEQILAEYAPDHDARGFAAQYDAFVSDA